MHSLAWVDDALVGLHNVVLRRRRLDLESHCGARMLIHNCETGRVLATASVVELQLLAVWEQSNETSVTDK